MKKHYNESTLREVIEDTYAISKELQLKALELFKPFEDYKHINELREKVIHASCYINEVEDETFTIGKHERRAYEDATRSIEHAIRTLDEARNSCTASAKAFQEAKEKTEIALAVSNYFNYPAKK
jgi:hypothetical protein